MSPSEAFTALDPADIREKLGSNSVIDEDVVVDLLDRMIAICREEDNVLFLPAPIIVCGDIHGQMFDLFKLFSLSPELPESRYLFLGDYVDRGYQSIQTFIYLAYLKVKFPTSIYLLRGNHEGRSVNMGYGFRNQCVTVYGHSGLWEKFNSAFDSLPYAAVVNDKYFCVHGGLSPDLSTIEEVMLFDRFQDIPEEGPLSDLVWSDPDESGRVEGYRPNTRGAGHIFGEKIVDEFLARNNLSCILRAHQIAAEGFKWIYENKLAIVWSAPNYTYKSNNKACVFCINKDGSYDIKIFTEDEKSDLKPVDVPDLVPYFA